ncbi:MAG: type II CAAX prenyl endopeptidase Rce1 family protein [Acidobacteriota bacterium]
MTGVDDGARSDRLTSGLEVVSVLTSVLLVTWGIVPLVPRLRWVMAIPFLLSLALMMHSHWRRGETAEEIGLTSRHLWSAGRRLILPMAIAATILLLIGVKTGMLQGPRRISPLLLPLILSGIAQQYLLQGFIHRRIRLTLGAGEEGGARPSTTAAFLTACCFAIVHAPNLTLTLLTFGGGLVWSRVYQKAPNIYAIGISHGLMSLLVINTLPPWILHSLSVGYKHFLYQKF